MKKIFLLICLLFAVVFTGCEVQNDTIGSLPMLDNETTDNGEYDTGNNSDEEPSVSDLQFLMTQGGEYIYVDQMESIEVNNDYKIKSIKELSLVGMGTSHIVVDDSMKGDVFIKFGDDEIKVQYYQSYIADNDNAESLISKYHTTNLYRDDKGGRYKVLDYNGLMTQYKRHNETYDENSTYISENDAVDIANQFIVNILGEEIVGGYEMEDDVGYIMDRYWVTFTKYIFGYPTKDYIIVCVNQYGDVTDYIGNNINIFKEAEKEYLSDSIEEASNQLYDTLLLAGFENVRMNGLSLDITDEGEICIGVYVTYGSKGEKVDKFYLKAPK